MTIFWESICRSSHWRCSVKKGVLKNFESFTGKHLRWSLFLTKLQASSLQDIQKETPTQEFSSKHLFWIHFEEHLQTTTSVFSQEVEQDLMKQSFLVKKRKDQIQSLKQNLTYFTWNEPLYCLGAKKKKNKIWACYCCKAWIAWLS